MRNIFRTGRSTNFKLATQTEDEHRYHWQAPRPARSKVKVERSRVSSGRCWPIRRVRNVLKTKLVGRLPTPWAIMHTSKMKRSKVKVNSRKCIMSTEREGLRTSKLVHRWSMCYQLSRPAITACEVGFLHAGWGIPCWPHMAAIQLVSKRPTKSRGNSVVVALCSRCGLVCHHSSVQRTINNWMPLHSASDSRVARRKLGRSKSTETGSSWLENSAEKTTRHSIYDFPSTGCRITVHVPRLSLTVQ